MRIDEIVRQMSPTRYTRAQAAALVGKSEDTLNRWEKKGWYTPSDSRMFGSTEVGLYTPDDIKAMKALAKQTPSRKPKAALVTPPDGR